eukprot:snap_masked-scaffold_2-processed-gene-0.33-mRNA-1 protein AED:1.00 eAED:1.00 QI:0/0/0/0/1/1/2/0/867
MKKRKQTLKDYCSQTQQEPEFLTTSAIAGGFVVSKSEKLFILNDSTSLSLPSKRSTLITVKGKEIGFTAASITKEKKIVAIGDEDGNLSLINVENLLPSGKEKNIEPTLDETVSTQATRISQFETQVTHIKFCTFKKDENEIEVLIASSGSSLRAFFGVTLQNYGECEVQSLNVFDPIIKDIAFDKENEIIYVLSEKQMFTLKISNDKNKFFVVSTKDLYRRTEYADLARLQIPTDFFPNQITCCGIYRGFLFYGLETKEFAVRKVEGRKIQEELIKFEVPDIPKKIVAGFKQVLIALDDGDYVFPDLLFKKLVEDGESKPAERSETTRKVSVESGTKRVYAEKVIEEVKQAEDDDDESLSDSDDSQKNEVLREIEEAQATKFAAEEKLQSAVEHKEVQEEPVIPFNPNSTLDRKDFAFDSAKKGHEILAYNIAGKVLYNIKTNVVDFSFHDKTHRPKSVECPVEFVDEPDVYPIASLKESQGTEGKAGVVVWTCSYDRRYKRRRGGSRKQANIAEVEQSVLKSAWEKANEAEKNGAVIEDEEEDSKPFSVINFVPLDNSFESFEYSTKEQIVLTAVGEEFLALYTSDRLLRIILLSSLQLPGLFIDADVVTMTAQGDKLFLLCTDGVRVYRFSKNHLELITTVFLSRDTTTSATYLGSYKEVPTLCVDGQFLIYVEKLSSFVSGISEAILKGKLGKCLPVGINQTGKSLQLVLFNLLQKTTFPLDVSLSLLGLENDTGTLKHRLHKSYLEQELFRFEDSLKLQAETNLKHMILSAKLGKVSRCKGIIKLLTNTQEVVEDEASITFLNKLFTKAKILIQKEAESNNSLEDVVDLLASIEPRSSSPKLRDVSDEDKENLPNYKRQRIN